VVVAKEVLTPEDLNNAFLLAKDEVKHCLALHIFVGQHTDIRDNTEMR
jgi:hypothetical protein